MLIVKYKTDNIEIPISDEETKLFTNKSPFLSIEGSNYIVGSSFFDEGKKVKDVWRYNLSFCDKEWQLLSCTGDNLNMFDKGRFDMDINTKHQNILMILESPHKDEYDKNFNPKSPAVGETGSNFYFYFISHIFPILKSMGLNLDKNIKYNICFVNPVPFQTSLVEIHKKKFLSSLRNKVWKSLYPLCKSDFLARLQSYSPKVIINGCTSGLKDELNDVIKTFGNAQKFNTSHPSSWKRAFAAIKSIKT